MSCKPTPDLAGFKEAQDRHRQQQGENIVFLGEVLLTFSPGTPLDPQTGRPYDPMIQPTGSAVSSAAVRCGVAFRAVDRAGVSGGADVSAAGRFDSNHVLLNAPIAAASAVVGAKAFILRAEEYKITASKTDGISQDAQHRWIVYGRRK